MERIIFHIDVNNAFLSWQAAYNKENNIETIDLRDIASIVGGDEVKRKGIVLAKSEIAKKMGIKTGMPIFEARKICRNLVSVKPDFAIYKHYSNKLFMLLSEYSNMIEKYSIDEYFMDYTSSINLFGDKNDIAREISYRCKKELGFSVNIGISSNKLLAKMAGELEKPDKINTLYKEELKEKMYPLNISELFMVGRKTKAKLNLLNIHTIGDLANKHISFFERNFKDANAKMLYEYSRGIDNSLVNYEENERKSIGNSTTLWEDTKDTQKIKKILLALSESVSIRLRRNNLKGDVISITIKNSLFISYSKQKKINEKINTTNLIYKYALILFGELYKNESVRLLGISISNLNTSNNEQLSLFDTLKENDEKLDIVVDELREKYGVNVLKRATLLEGDGSKLNNKLVYFD